MMQLTDAEAAMFKGLQDTGTGRELSRFLGRLCDELCDVRNMPDADAASIRARISLAALVKSEVIDRIELSNKAPSKNGFE